MFKIQDLKRKGWIF